MKTHRWTIELHANARTERYIVTAADEAAAGALAIANATATGHVTDPAAAVVVRATIRRGENFSGLRGAKAAAAPAPVAPVSAPAPAGSVDALIAGIAERAAREAAAGVAATVDPEAVRAIAREEAAAATIDAEAVRAIVREVVERQPPRETRIAIGDSPAAIIDGPAHPLLEDVVRLVASPNYEGQRDNVMLVGPAGSGKTVLAHQVATVLAPRMIAEGRPAGCPFATTSLTAGTNESELVGRLFPTMNGHEYIPSAFVRMYADAASGIPGAGTGGVFLADEIDAADANTMLKLNQALANGGMSLPDGRYIRRDTWSVIIASANTWGDGASREYVGRGAHDGAFLDRWTVFALDYDSNVESRMVASILPGEAGDDLLFRWRAVRSAARAARIPRPVSMRKLLVMASQIARGAWTSPAAAIANATAGWSEAERRAGGLL